MNITVQIRRFIFKFNRFIDDRVISKIIFYFRNRVRFFDKFIKIIEFQRGLYRYPNQMLGRKMNINLDKTDVLVFAAHPDDDILGIGTVLYRHRLNDEKIKVVFVTNGTAGNGESWYRRKAKAKYRANLRYHEGSLALAQIGVPKKNIYCLGIPDGGTQRYMNQMAVDISVLINQLNPKRVYVHGIEGGHIDHDVTSFSVKSVCDKLGYTNVFEYTQYNPTQPIGAEKVMFLSSTIDNVGVEVIEISEVERKIKRKMLSFHKSQGVDKYYRQGETIRKANLKNSETELYRYCTISSRCLEPLVQDFQMHLLTRMPFREETVLETEYHSV